MNREIDENLPGAELVAPGLDDLWRGEHSIEALLVAIGAPRLRMLGLSLPAPQDMPDEPELSLYAALGRSHPHDTHSRYNGLIRRLISFEQALERVAYSTPAG